MRKSTSKMRNAVIQYGVIRLENGEADARGVRQKFHERCRKKLQKDAKVCKKKSEKSA